MSESEFEDLSFFSNNTNYGIKNRTGNQQYCSQNNMIFLTIVLKIL